MTKKIQQQPAPLPVSQELLNLIQTTSDNTDRPESIRILGKDVRIVYGSEEFGMTDLGLCHYDSCLINIRNGQRPVGERNTLLHEIVHMLDHSLFGMELSEKQVTVLTNGLMAVIEDNPEVAKYIIGLK